MSLYVGGGCRFPNHLYYYIICSCTWFYFVSMFVCVCDFLGFSSFSFVSLSFSFLNSWIVYVGCSVHSHLFWRSPGSTGLLNLPLKWIKWWPILLPVYTIGGGIVQIPLMNQLRVRSTPRQGRHPASDLPAVRLLAWADVIGHGGRRRGLEIHVGQHRGKDGRRTSVRRLMEGDPERPAAPLVWEPPCHGDSRRPLGAIQSIDRLYLWQFWEYQGYKLKNSATTITRGDRTVVETCVVVGLCHVQASLSILLKKKKESQRREYTLGTCKITKLCWFFFLCGLGVLLGALAVWIQNPKKKKGYWVCSLWVVMCKGALRGRKCRINVYQGWSQSRLCGASWVRFFFFEIVKDHWKMTIWFASGVRAQGAFQTVPNVKSSSLENSRLPNGKYKNCANFLNFVIIQMHICRNPRTHVLPTLRVCVALFY